MSNSVERLASALSDRYRIEHELGAGGMATVYLAEVLKHQRYGSDLTRNCQPCPEMPDEP